MKSGHRHNTTWAANRRRNAGVAGRMAKRKREGQRERGAERGGAVFATGCEHSWRKKKRSKVWRVISFNSMGSSVDSCVLKRAARCISLEEC